MKSLLNEPYLYCRILKQTLVKSLDPETVSVIWYHIDTRTCFSNAYAYIMQHLCVSHCQNRQAQKMVFIGSIELIIAHVELLI